MEVNDHGGFEVDWRVYKVDGDDETGSDHVKTTTRGTRVGGGHRGVVDQVDGHSLLFSRCNASHTSHLVLNYHPINCPSDTPGACPPKCTLTLSHHHHFRNTTLSKSRPTMNGTPLCPTCSRPVYHAEQTIGPGRRMYHKPCLVCSSCKTRVDPGALQEHAGEAYCRNCHRMLFSPRGRSLVFVRARVARS